MGIKHFTELNVWREGHKLVLDLYDAVSSFPKEELFGLSSQIKRAVVSITANIAEGFVRRSKKEKVQFYYISLGSLSEVENHLIIARDLRFITLPTYTKLQNQTIFIAKMIYKLIVSIHANY